MAKGKDVAVKDETAVSRLTQTEASALALLEEYGIKVAGIQDAEQVIGDGWHVIDKADLVGVPFIAVDYRFADSKKHATIVDGVRQPMQFLIMKVVTDEFVQSGGKDGKYVVTDGGSGLMKQIGEWIEKEGIDLSGETVPALICKRGLVESNYEFTNEKTGEIGEATTYYLGV